MKIYKTSAFIESQFYLAYKCPGLFLAALSPHSNRFSSD